MAYLIDVTEEPKYTDNFKTAMSLICGMAIAQVLVTLVLQYGKAYL